MSEAELADPKTRVPVASLTGLLDATLRETGDRDIGLLAAERVDSLHLGLMEDVARTRTTLRSALEAGIRYVPLVGEGIHYSFDVEGDLATSRIWFDPDIHLHEAALEFILAVGLLWARRVAGDESLAPQEIHFVHRQPADISRHQALFRCKLHFGALVTEVVMRAAALERELGGNEPTLGKLLVRRAEGELDALPGLPDATSQVRRMLLSQKELRHITASQVARRLGVGTRTLARRLREEQTSYRALHDALRTEVAQRELAQNTRSIAEIAESLGFASPQGFNRAFRRWTGTSAANWRRNHR